MSLPLPPLPLPPNPLLAGVTRQLPRPPALPLPPGPPCTLWDMEKVARDYMLLTLYDVDNSHTSVGLTRMEAMRFIGELERMAASL